MTLRPVAFLVLCGAASTSFAQLYTWKDPDTGGTLMSTSPPAWYSAKDIVRGPRVLVTLRERLIDDTGLPLEQRLNLNRPPRKLAQGPNGYSAAPRTR